MAEPKNPVVPVGAGHTSPGAAAGGTRPWRVWLALAGIFAVLVFYDSGRFAQVLQEADLQLAGGSGVVAWLPPDAQRALQEAFDRAVEAWGTVEAARRSLGLAFLIDGEHTLGAAAADALRLDFSRLGGVGAPPGQLTVHAAGPAVEAPPANVYLIVGDSMVLSPLGSILGESLVATYGGRYFRHGVVATGLSRRDYYDWPRELGKLMAQYRPNVVVVLMGLNDIRAARTAAGKLVAFGKEAFQEAYRDNIRAFLNVAEEAGVTVYWLEVPMTEAAATNEKLTEVNGIQKAVTAEFPNVHHVSTWDLLADDQGRPRPYLKLPGERSFHPWSTDGIHLTAAGGRYVAQSVLGSFDPVLLQPPLATDSPQAGRSAPSAPDTLRCFRYQSQVVGGETETCLAAALHPAPLAAPVLLLHPASVSRDVLAELVLPWARKLGIAIVLQPEPSAPAADGGPPVLPERRGIAQQYLAEVRRASLRAGAASAPNALLVIASGANGVGMSLLARGEFACASLLRMPPPNSESLNPPALSRSRPEPGDAERPLRPSRMMTAPAADGAAARAGFEQLRRGEYAVLPYPAQAAWLAQVPRHLVWHRLCQRFGDPRWPATPMEGGAALAEAVDSSLPDVAAALLARGVSAQARDAQGNPMLLRAVTARRAAVVDLLLEHGADPNARNDEGWPTLAVATQRGDLGLVRRLIEAGAKVDGRDRQDRTALMVAAWKGNRPLVDALVDAHAEVNAADRDGESALMKAVKYNRQVTAERLIELGADLEQPDRTGKTPLMQAAYYNRTAAATLLLDHGAKVEARDRVGWTPLMEAARAGSLGSLRLLLERGASPLTLAKDRKSALHLAARDGRLAAVRALLAARALPDRRDRAGLTPLLYAARYGQRSVVTALLEGGAPVDAADPEGATALLYAARQADLDLATILIRAGADPAHRNSRGESPQSIAAAGTSQPLRRLLGLPSASGQGPNRK